MTRAQCSLRLVALAAVLLLPALRAVSAEHPAVSRDMAGVWLPDGRRSGRPPSTWPLNAVAKQAQQRYREQYAPVDPTIDDANASCITESMPYPIRLFAQYPFEILFTPDRVTMFFEIYGSVRRIPVGQPAPVLEVLPTAMGRSAARWEGNTLVIETTNIRRDGAGLPFGDPPVSNARRIIERLTMGADEEGKKQLRSDITIEDPVVLEAPVSFRMFYKWSAEFEVGEYLCQQDIWDQNLQGSPSTVPWRQ